MRSAYLPFGKPDFGEAEIAAVTRVLRSGWVGMGPETLAFELELAEAVGSPHVVTVNSCTSALFLALMISGVKAGDDVLCPSLTWCSTANAVLYLGARPVFCDVDADTLCLSPRDVSTRVTARTTAAIVVHFAGLAADVEALRRALPPGLPIVEDAAHAFGGVQPDGRPVGASDGPTCFSFYANKNLSTGEGGAVALADSTGADRLRRLRQHSLPLDAWRRFQEPRALLLSSDLAELGYKMNYTDLQASLGRVQLARQAEFSATRAAIAKRYVERLRDLDPPLRFQQGCDSSPHAKHLFVVQLPLERMLISREELVRRMRARNLGVTIHYAPLHLMPLYAVATTPPSLAVTEDVARRCLTLPISASMTLDDADEVVHHLRDCIGAI